MVEHLSAFTRAFTTIRVNPTMMSAVAVAAIVSSIFFELTDRYLPSGLSPRWYRENQ